MWLIASDQTKINEIKQWFPEDKIKPYCSYKRYTERKFIKHNWGLSYAQNVKMLK